MAESAKEGVTAVLSKPTEWWGRSRDFVSKVREEMHRVTWPSRREVYATTFVVILTSIFFGVYLFTLDVVFNRLISWIFREMGAQ
jgi:preprotein translocase subunit SecE